MQGLRKKKEESDFGFGFEKDRWEILVAKKSDFGFSGEEKNDGGGDAGVVEERWGTDQGRSIIKVAVAATTSGVGILIIILVFCFMKKISSDNSMAFWRKKTKNYQNIEAFIRNYGSLAPKRYSYSQIKKMTNSFQVKLGQGGYEGVYKGMLHDGRDVAVKVLNESKGNGEEFINEVASIGTTSQVNVFSLFGYCFQGCKRALIYEFVPNDSLEKFMYQKNPIYKQLKREKLYQIAVGIAEDKSIYTVELMIGEGVGDGGPVVMMKNLSRSSARDIFRSFILRSVRLSAALPPTHPSSLSHQLSCIFFLLTRSSTTASGSTVDPQYLACVNKTCGDGQNISFAFYIKDQQQSFCGLSGFELSCNNKGSPILGLPGSDNQYVIHHIFYNNQTLHVSNSAFWDTKSSTSGSRVNYCDVVSSLKNLSLPSDYLFELLGGHNTQVSSGGGGDKRTLSERLVSKKVDGCWNGDEDSVVAVDEGDPDLGLAREECTEMVVAPVEGYGGESTSMMMRLRGGFLMKWTASDCSACAQSGGKCGFDNSTLHFKCFCPDRPHAWNCTILGTDQGRSIIKVAVAATASGVGILIIILVFCFRKKNSSDRLLAFWKKKTKNYQNIEAFIRNYGSVAPKKYSYSQIKKMTNSFKVKLGQRGYGGVYKGMLHDGRDVAVKVLNESKGNGEEFINEVASISRTSHVNVVSLFGYCFQGRKRALIYEFMPNGSLEKFIYQKNPNYKQLKWEKLYQMHPKISDFGLAKFFPGRESIIPMMGARGTIGYIAPEVCCREFGEVSHKSDVYSYGMMVLEMAGGRKNIDVGVGKTSEIYFPHWVYERLEVDEELGLQGIENEEDKQSARKMIIVSLWCIQTNPSSRPAMNRVVEMLEGSLDSLQIPPKPFLSSSISQPQAPDSSASASLIC
ncbi:hypothetical protein Ddye_030006 [Dipteronia dyeriana]|uniref:non-specific serine/threonine protein kinase n=1 Tax=Dipteronia dyeriana TaxID=168575 RepID=A0AAD9TFH5_9ROSI|nr:hypothetical protein Ddye_030006 [Dipteronia dyeriana]